MVGYIQDEYANTLKKNRSPNTTISDEHKKEETDCDDKDDTNTNGTMAFNVVVDLKDTPLHDDDNNISDEDSLHSNEEVSLKEL